jgi:putative exosortase-associated protein (TIGR04073 family)
MKRLVLFGLLVAGVLCIGVCGDAQAQSATEKLGRGIANTFLGVFEIPNQMFNTYRENTGNYIPTRDRATIKALSVGPVRGVREAFRRTGHGLWDTVTFLSPGPGGNNFKTRVQPEYITEVSEY